MSIAISFMIVGGVNLISSITGCGDNHNEYQSIDPHINEVLTKSKTVSPKQVEPDLVEKNSSCSCCGGSLFKCNQVTRAKESHHSKKVLPKHNRMTIRQTWGLHQPLNV